MHAVANASSLSGRSPAMTGFSLCSRALKYSHALQSTKAIENTTRLSATDNTISSVSGLPRNVTDREEAFATAVSGLSGIISTANVMAVKCTADKIPDESEKIQLEVTGRLCACCGKCLLPVGQKSCYDRVFIVLKSS